jgi:tRNA G18 (ribose-2'-O)-methylase SpoU
MKELAGLEEGTPTAPASDKLDDAAAGRRGSALDRVIRIVDPADPHIAPFRDLRERDLVGRGGMFIAEGKVVLAVLAAKSPESVEAVLVLKERLQGIEKLLPLLPSDTPVYAAEGPVLDRIAGFHLHRGVLALARKPEQLGLPDFLRSVSEDPLLVVLSGISNHDNMGGVFRNAAAFEASGIVLDALCCDPLYRKSIRVSVGAALQVPFTRGLSLKDICRTLTENGYALAALSPRGRRPVEDIQSSGKRALILGSEGEGLPEEILASTATYSIPMSSAFDSLNVATSSGIALYHSSRFSRRTG